MSGDTYYNDVSLLLHMDGANGSTTFTDNSPTPKTVTANGNAQVSTTQSKFGGASGYFDGTGDYLSIPSNNAFSLSGNFTVECWIYPTALNTFNMLLGSENGVSSDYFVVRANTLELGFANASLYPAWSFSFSTNQWYHVAITRNSNTLRAFVNGTELSLSSGSATNSTQLFVSGTALSVGRYGNTSSPHYFTGYIDDLRITKGVARYTSNFTAPTAAFPNGPIINALFQDNGPLGNANVLAILNVDALLSDSGPLGRPSVLGNHLFAFASAPSVLGSQSLLAFHLFGQVQAASPLGASNSLLTHDFTGQLGDATTYYVMDLSTPSGPVRVPISSWQATLQTGLSNYVQCVVPAAQSYVTQINAATQFKILRRVTLPDGFVIEYQMASGPLQTVTLDQGPFQYTATIAGYSSGFAINETPSPAYNRTMQGLRSVSVSEGKARVRCSIDWLLRPSQRVFAGDRNFIASYINYYVGNNDAYMEVGER